MFINLAIQETNSFAETIEVMASVLKDKYTEKKLTILKDKFTKFSNMIVQLNYDQASDSSWGSMKQGLQVIKGLLSAFIELKKKKLYLTFFDCIFFSFFSYIIKEDKIIFIFIILTTIERNTSHKHLDFISNIYMKQKN